MPHSFDPVFGDWYTENQLGSGTDGKAYTITRTLSDGTVERAVLKTIRVGDYRNEKKSFNKLNEAPQPAGEDTLREKIISNITDNIDIIRKTDNGKHFVRYEGWEKRKTSDGKGTLIMIRLEEMRSLTDVLDNFSLTRDETLRLGISLCKALARCRDFGYIYPNLKPENILFDRKGLCKLGDFGSFSCLEPSKTSVAYKRTQYYMAPEYIRTGKINCTADTYALGLVLYSLINRGRLPFTEPYPQELTVASFDRSKQNRLDGVAFPPPALYDESLCLIIGKACAFLPENRYLSPKQMLADLEAALANRPLGNMQFEDIYSVSDPMAQTAEAPQIEPIPTPYSPPVPPTYGAPSAPIFPTSAPQREEPDEEPSEPEAPAPTKAAKAAAVVSAIPEKLGPVVSSVSAKLRKPAAHKPAQKRKPQPLRRVLLLLAIAVCLIILLVISLALRFGSADTPTLVEQTVPAMLFVLERSDTLWLMI